MSVSTHTEFTSLKLGISRFCLTALKQNHVKFDFLQSWENKIRNKPHPKNPDVSPDTVVYIRILRIVGYMIGFEAVRNASDICFGRLEMHNTYINVFEVKIEKASSRRESNPGHLWLVQPVFCHWATTTGQPPALTILYTCTAQVVLNTSVAHLAVTQYVLSESC